MPNTNVQLQAILTMTNQLLLPPAIIDTWNFQNPTCQATNFLKEPFLQATTGGVTITLPAATVFFILVQNLHATAVLRVTVTPTGGSASASTYGPGGLFFAFDPTESGGGFTALTLTGVSTTVPAFVVVGS